MPTVDVLRHAKSVISTALMGYAEDQQVQSQVYHTLGVITVQVPRHGGRTESVCGGGRGRSCNSVRKAQ